MRTLHETLRDAEDGLLDTIAAVWGLNPIPKKRDELVDQLGEIMLSPETNEKVWDKLSEQSRQALQAILGSQRQIPEAMYTRIFGEIRRLGKKAIEREQPHINPQSSAEELYYWGFTAIQRDMAASGARNVIYVPDDLADALPTHKTAYDNLDSEPQPTESIGVVDASELEAVRTADTSIVDDLTTFLAFVQLYSPTIEGESLSAEALEALKPYLLNPNNSRLAFILLIAVSGEMIDVKDSKLTMRRAEARQWLEASRAEQVRQLVEIWRSSRAYRELWHVPSLRPERGGSLDSHDPTIARAATLEALSEFVPESEWFPVDEFVYAIKESDPDFQRPGGDYDSWYIQSTLTEEYLTGFESWDEVEGELLEFIIIGPFHWLGLADVAPDAARLTAYGRATLGIGEWRDRPDAEAPAELSDTGELRISRKVSRLDRFQAARFTTWQPAPDPAGGEPYIYVLNRTGIEQAETQGINTGHIMTFLKRVQGDKPIPERVDRLLSTWKAGDVATATLEQVVILRTMSEDVMNEIINAPELRRYLGARLGAMTVIVRQDQWEPLRTALIEFNIKADYVTP